MKKSKNQYKYAIRRLKKCNDIIQREKFIEGLLSPSGNIFKEIKRFRGKVNTVSSNIDGITGSQNIANVFAEKYQKLYNDVKNNDELATIEETINARIDGEIMKTIEDIDEQLVRVALKKMKPTKHDAIFTTVSNCYTEGPQSLVFHLKNIL